MITGVALPLLGIACGAWLVAAGAYVALLLRDEQDWAFAAATATLLGLLFQIAGLAMWIAQDGLWNAASRSGVTMTWAALTVVVFLAVAWRWQMYSLGAPLLILVALVDAGALLLWPSAARGPVPLAAQRNGWWVLYLVLVSLAGGGLTVLSAAVLLRSWWPVGCHPLDKRPPLPVVEHFLLVGGLLGLLLGVAAHAWWSWQTWGQPWQWAPDEVAVGLAGLLYAAYGHGRRSRELAESRAWAGVALLGLLAVLGMVLTLQNSHFGL